MTRILLSVCCFLMGLTIFGQENNWLTHYERSGFTETPRFDETMRYVKKLDDYSKKIQLFEFGKSAQGRALTALVYDKDGLSTPDEIRRAGRIILFVQACIHPGESEGKDAMLILLRDLVVHGKNEKLFDKTSLLFVPIFNADGHERFSPYGRINQNGPKEMGWRTTATNLNLNRDHTKADAPEMQAWLQLYHQWQPEFFIDTHTSNGADYQYAITYVLETGGQMDAALTEWQQNNYLKRLESSMDKAGFPLFPYVSFRRWHDPRSGLIGGVASPMFSQGYTAVRNRPGLLVETHMLKPYKVRVDATVQIILSTLEILYSEGASLQKLIRAADQYTASERFRDQPFPLRFSIDMKDSVMVPFKGVAYNIIKSDLTGGDWFVYDNKKPQLYNLPFFNQSKPAVEIRLPEAYIIPKEWSEVIFRCQLHGIEMFPLPEDALLDVEMYHFKTVEFARTSYEGRHRVSRMDYEMRESQQVFPAGSYVIPMNQPLARLIPYLLEPNGSSSFLEWGFFNIIFEQKEYAESYVMEPLARQMLDSIPGLREEFEMKKAADQGFATNSWQQLNWFYSKTPWWDNQYLKYPIGRVVQQSQVPVGNIRRTK